MFVLQQTIARAASTNRSDLQNKKLLDDELYLGLKQNRVRGDEYDVFVDKFVMSVQKLYPKAYLHLYEFSSFRLFFLFCKKEGGLTRYQ